MSESNLTDPLDRTIRLHDATWFGHILRNHRELRAHRSEVEQAVTGPTVIHFSTSDADCRLYYGPSSRDGLMICVVADVVAGLVKTAYFAKRIKQGDREWP